MVSVPFTRTARVLLSSEIFERLRLEHDVLVVSPSAEDEAFQREFGGPNTRFYRFRGEGVYRRRIPAVLYGVSELLRFQGYYFRYRRAGLEYYWRGRDVVHGRGGEDRRRGPGARAAMTLLGYLGYAPAAWRLADRVAAPLVHDVAEIGRIADGYDSVAVVQVASFGEQERFLSYCARKFGFRTLLLPYTTDQLTINGHLLSRFDRVLAQGPWEARCATEMHGVPAERVHTLGSLWFRNMDRIRRMLEERGESAPREPGAPRVVMYAGHSSMYFPRESEYAAVDAVLAAMRAGVFGPARLVYRPITEGDDELDDLVARYGGDPLVEIQFPQASCIGITGHTRGEVAAELAEYVKQLLEVDVLVMSYLTSMCLDAYYLGRGVVSNCADATGTLERRGAEVFLAADVNRVVRSGMPMARSLPELVEAVRDALDRPEQGREAGRRLVAEWDHPREDYVGEFMRVLNACL
ncbi:MAG TPA: hypothetical protein VHG51_05825 [Longimicrobiaceae bacterium]|nr:hypothetical protein [Longimicrobiaceae bacterium]